MAGVLLPGSARGGSGDIEGVTAGVGLSGGGSSGSVTLTLDLSELSDVTPANGDKLATIDSDGANEQLTTVASLATLFAGDGLTASSSVLAVNVDDSTIETNSDAIRIKDDGVTLAKMAGLARGKIIYGDASGDPAALAAGGANTFLKSDGTDIAWAAAPATAADDISTGDGAVNIVTSSGNITIDAQANDADVIIKVDDNGSAVTAVTFDGSAEGNAIFVNDIELKSDSAVLKFGADLDTTLTHTDGTGLTLNSTNKLTFGDAATFIHQSGDGVMTIDGEATIDLNASTAVLVSNDLKLDSDAAVLSFGADSEATITHADDAGLTFNSDITMAADKSLKLPQGANIKFTDAITQDSIDDHDAQGIIMTFTAGMTITPFSPVYLHTDDEVHEADADAIATMPAIGVSINTSNVTDGNPVEVMVLGLIRDESFTDFGTNGAPLYVHTGVGEMSNTAPSGTDDVVQVIGHSIGEKLIFVQPCLTTIEHA